MLSGEQELKKKKKRWVADFGDNQSLAINYNNLSH